jgi:hypothetical protein
VEHGGDDDLFFIRGSLLFILPSSFEMRLEPGAPVAK